MTVRRTLTAVWMLALAASACSSDDDGSAAGDADGGDIDASSGSDGGPITDEWVSLITGDWTLAAGTERYVCVRKTVTEDMYIRSFRAVIPNGTHHTVLTVGPPTKSDGVEPCTSLENAARQIYGSGVGTNAFDFPEGVAVKIDAGQQLLLNLHLFNATMGELSETSGTEIKLVAAEDVVHEAESILMGPVSFSIPAQQTHEVVGGCTMNGDVTLVAMQPHMHLLGTHMKVVAKSSTMGDVTLWDRDYNFDEQVVERVGPVEMSAGDQVEVSCTYNNITDDTVGFGESTTDEMCFAGIYRYPVLGGPFGFICPS